MGLLRSMSPRTRRPIRFLEPANQAVEENVFTTAQQEPETPTVPHFLPTAAALPGSNSEDSQHSTQLSDRSDWAQSSGNLNHAPSVEARVIQLSDKVKSAGLANKARNA
jgi:hypothetical protein